VMKGRRIGMAAFRGSGHLERTLLALLKEEGKRRPQGGTLWVPLAPEKPPSRELIFPTSERPGQFGG